MPDFLFQAYLSKFRAGLLFVLSAGFAALLLWLGGFEQLHSSRREFNWINGHPQILWVGAVFFLLTTIAWGRQLFRSKATIEADKDGIIFSNISAKKIPWSNIKNIRVMKVQRNLFLEFELFDAEGYQLNLFYKIMRAFSFSKKYHAGLSHMNKSPEEIASAVRSGIQLYGRK